MRTGSHRHAVAVGVRVAEIAYLGYVPLFHPVHHCASQKYRLQIISIEPGMQHE